MAKRRETGRMGSRRHGGHGEGKRMGHVIKPSLVTGKNAVKTNPSSSAAMTK